MVVDKKRRQIELASRNETSINRLATVKTYRLRKTDTDVSLCGPAVLMSNPINYLHAGLSMCSCTIGTHIINNIEYRRYQCPPGICNCGQLMFQWSLGGCIPYLYVCDNAYNCADSSDQFCIADGVGETRKKPHWFSICHYTIFPLLLWFSMLIWSMHRCPLCEWPNTRLQWCGGWTP